MGSTVFTKRRFVRRPSTLVDVDYFDIAWTHLTVDASVRIMSADARGTAERTATQHTWRRSNDREAATVVSPISDQRPAACRALVQGAKPDVDSSVRLRNGLATCVKWRDSPEPLAWANLSPLPV